MFKKKTDNRKIELLSPAEVSTMQESQLLKYYFPEYNNQQRKGISSRMKMELKLLNLQELNVGLYQFLLSSEKQKTDDLHKLVYSVVMNSLAYEGNEEIKKSVYKDYHDINIRKYSKPFIAGQIRIFETAYEGLFFAAEKEVQVTTENIDRIVKLVLDISLNHSSNVQDLENLLLEFRRQKVMKMKRISKIDAVTKWNKVAIYAYDSSTGTDWQINTIGTKSSILDLEKNTFDHLFTD